MSRQQSVSRNTVGYMLINIDNQTTDGEEKSKPEVIKLGLDLHARQVTECRQLDGSTPKPAQQWDPWKLLDKVEEWVKAGIKVYSCYEAGPCGYWYHRELTKRGAVNYVVAPRLLENQRSKRQKDPGVLACLVTPTYSEGSVTPVKSVGVSILIS